MDERINTRDAGDHTRKLRTFKSNGARHARQHSRNDGTTCYVVISYQEPIYVYDYEARAWCGNNEKYSVTTSRHQSAAMPGSREDIVWMGEDEIKRVIRQGFVKARLHPEG